MNIDEAKFAVKVLTCQPGFSDADPKIDQELTKILERYNELKRKRGFEESANLAKAEWLVRFTQPAAPVGRG